MWTSGASDGPLSLLNNTEIFQTEDIGLEFIDYLRQVAAMFPGGPTGRRGLTIVTVYVHRIVFDRTAGGWHWSTAKESVDLPSALSLIGCVLKIKLVEFGLQQFFVG